HGKSRPPVADQGYVIKSVNESCVDMIPLKLPIDCVVPYEVSDPTEKQKEVSEVMPLDAHQVLDKLSHPISMVAKEIGTTETVYNVDDVSVSCSAENKFQQAS
ncbi:hypothetical protein U1Q18_049807, partial [Sarracenia purpurea var. burkii]